MILLSFKRYNPNTTDPKHSKAGFPAPHFPTTSSLPASLLPPLAWEYLNLFLKEAPFHFRRQCIQAISRMQETRLFSFRNRWDSSTFPLAQPSASALAVVLECWAGVLSLTVREGSCCRDLGKQDYFLSCFVPWALNQLANAPPQGKPPLQWLLLM